MKRSWSPQEGASSSDESSSSDTDQESDNRKKAKGGSKAGQSSKEKPSGVPSVKRKSGAIGFEALRQHGYRGGLSILNVPAPKDDGKNQDWSWSTGEDRKTAKETEESYAERQKTRAALADGEQLSNVQTRKDKNLSFSQKEKRKRDIGQASRGKNYVEEEKRLLRDNGVYSGFDS